MQGQGKEDQSISNRQMAELADLLATGYLRFRKRQARREAETFFEKRLDDVGDSARFGTRESRTSEKGTQTHEG